MKNSITLNDGFAGEVTLLETLDGQKYVHKAYSHNSSLDINNEWNTLVFLYNQGYSVPKPIKRSKNGLYMQYIDNGTFWKTYEKADKHSGLDMIIKFTKLLNGLHAIKLLDVDISSTYSFIHKELSDIKYIIDKHHLKDISKVVDRLEILSAGIKEQKHCYLHRDYHPWNVLLDKDGKMYVIDLVLTFGDSRFDVAWTYALMSRSGYNEFADMFLTEYIKLESTILNDFSFFMLLVNVRWLANVKASLMLKNSDNYDQKAKSDFLQKMIKKAEYSISNYIDQ